LEAISTIIDVRPSGVENLEIDFVRVGGSGIRDGVDVSKSPDTKDFIACL
jgi:hypothetical protein